MTWTLERFRTVDGLMMGSLPAVNFSWSRSVRDSSMTAGTGLGAEASTGIDISIDAIEDAGIIDRDYTGWQDNLREAFVPLKYGIAALYDGVPITAGVISSPVNLDDDKISLSVDGITSILANRYLVPEDLSPSKRYYWSGVSLATIAKRIIQQVMQKPSGSLPITFDADETADHERTYNAFNVSNLSATSLIEAISNVENGPDIDFRPYMVSDRYIAWHMHCGTEHYPYIGQDAMHDWEQGSPSVESVTAKLSAEYVSHRVYAVGDGQDETTRLVKVDGQIAQYWPFVETVISDSAWDSDDLALQHAQANLSPLAVLQITANVRANGVNPLGQFWPGDLANLTTHGHPAIADGTHLLRIQAMSGGNDEKVELLFDPISSETI